MDPCCVGFGFLNVSQLKGNRRAPPRPAACGPRLSRKRVHLYDLPDPQPLPWQGSALGTGGKRGRGERTQRSVAAGTPLPLRGPAAVPSSAADRNGLPPALHSAAAHPPGSGPAASWAALWVCISNLIRSLAPGVTPEKPPNLRTSLSSSVNRETGATS